MQARKQAMSNETKLVIKQLLLKMEPRCDYELINYFINQIEDEIKSSGKPELDFFFYCGVQATIEKTATRILKEVDNHATQNEG